MYFLVSLSRIYHFLLLSLRIIYNVKIILNVFIYSPNLPSVCFLYLRDFFFFDIGLLIYFSRSMTGTCDNNDGKEIKKNENESIIFIAKRKEGEGARDEEVAAMAAQYCEDVSS